MASRLITQMGNNVRFSEDKKSIIGVIGNFNNPFKTGVASKELRVNQECTIDEQAFKNTDADNVILLIDGDTDKAVGRSSNGLFKLILFKDKITFKLDIDKLESGKHEFQRSMANDVLTMVKQNKVASTSMIIQDEQKENKDGVDYINDIGKILVISINQ